MENSEHTKPENFLKQPWGCFTIIGAFAVVATIIALCLWHNYNVERQEKVFQLYRQNIEYSDSLLVAARTELLDSLHTNPHTTLENYNTLERLTTISNGLSSQHTAASLIEVEFNKVQSQYEALGIWAGILAIVFLIFSLYNIFRADELRKEAQSALRDLNDINTESLKTFKEIQQLKEKGKEQVHQLERDFKQIAEQLSQTKDKVQTIVDNAKTQIAVQQQKSQQHLEYLDTVLKTYTTELQRTRKQLDEIQTRQSQISPVEYNDYHEPGFHEPERNDDAIDDDITETDNEGDTGVEEKYDA
ncbi:MAG: hypothetical protein J1F20_00945 [Muribaculaceae bacterium]|nr:hypothetical protein [Muribaculaceae bacterium]